MVSPGKFFLLSNVDVTSRMLKFHKVTLYRVESPHDPYLVAWLFPSARGAKLFDWTGDDV